MTKEFRSRQVLRYGTAVNGDERLVRTFAQLMDAMSHIFFPGSAGSINQYRHLCGSYQSYVVVYKGGKTKRVNMWSV